MPWSIKTGDRIIVSNVPCPEYDMQRIADGISEEYGDPNVTIEAE